MDTKEKFARPMSGYVMLVVVIAMIAFFIYNVVNHAGLVWLMVVSAVILALALVLMPGFLVVNPNESSVLV